MAQRATTQNHKYHVTDASKRREYLELALSTRPNNEEREEKWRQLQASNAQAFEARQQAAQEEEAFRKASFQPASMINDMGYLSYLKYKSDAANTPFSMPKTYDGPGYQPAAPARTEEERQSSARIKYQNSLYEQERRKNQGNRGSRFSRMGDDAASAGDKYAQVYHYVSEAEANNVPTMNGYSRADLEKAREDALAAGFTDEDLKNIILGDNVNTKAYLDSEKDKRDSRVRVMESQREKDADVEKLLGGLKENNPEGYEHYKEYVKAKESAFWKAEYGEEAQQGFIEKSKAEKQAAIDAGVDVDDKYLYQYMKEEIDREETQEQEALIRAGLASSDPVTKAAANAVYTISDIAASPITGLAAATETLNKKLNYADKRGYVNTNNPAYSLQNMTNAVEGQQRQNIADYGRKKGWSDLGIKVATGAYDIGMSTSKAALSMAIGQGIGSGVCSAMGFAANSVKGEKIIETVANIVTLPSFGAGAYTQALQECYERGLPEDQAQKTALVAGIAEMATEVVSLDLLLETYNKGGKAAMKEIIGDVLKNAAVEGSEELTSDIVNDIADAMINGDKSGHEQAVRQYMAEGMTRENAEKQAIKEQVIQYALDFGAGAASGVILSGGTVAAREINNMKEAGPLFDAEEYSELAESIDTSEESYSSDDEVAVAKKTVSKLEELAAKKENGEKISANEKREAYDLIEETMSNAERAINDREQTGQDERDFIPFEEAEIPEEFRKTSTATPNEVQAAVWQAGNASELAEAVEMGRNSESVNNAAIKEIVGNAAATLADKGIPREEITRIAAAIDEPTQEEAYRAGYSGGPADGLSIKNRIAHNEGRQARLRKAVKESSTNEPPLKASATVDGKTIEVRGFADEPSRGIVLKTSEGDIPSSSVRFNDPATEKLYAKAAALHDTESANTFLESYPGNVMPIGLYTSTFNRFYNAGSAGVQSFDSVFRKNDVAAQAIGEDNLRRIYDFAKERTEKSRASKAEGKKKRQGGGTLKDVRENKTDTPMLDVMRGLANNLGIDIEYTDKLEAGVNGMFDKGLSTIFIGEGTGKEFQTLLHETSEFIKAYDPEMMEEFRNLLAEYFIDTKGQGYLEELIGKYYKANYEKAYDEMGLDETFGEMLDEAMFDALKGVFYKGDGVESFTEWIYGKKEYPDTIIGKIKKFMDELIESIKEWLIRNEKGNIQSAEITRGMGLERAEKIRDAFYAAADSAKRKYQAEPVAKDGDSAVAYSRERLAISEEEQKHNRDTVLDMKPVKKVPFEFLENAGGNKKKAILELFDSIGNKAINPIIGEVALTKKSIKSDAGHGWNPDKVATYPAIPSVIENGKIVGYTEKYRNNNVSRYIIAAPIEIEKEGEISNHLMGVVVQSDANTQRLYLHSVVEIKFEDSLPVRGDNAAHLNQESSSVKSILQDIINNNIKNKGSAKSDNGKTIPVSELKEIRQFSLETSPEHTKDLIAVHNLSESDLLGTLELGGFPMPSIAIVKNNAGHDDFGDISVVFGRESIDPKANPGNKVYSADAYTPTFPRVDVKINEEAAEKLWTKMRELTSRGGTMMINPTLFEGTNLAGKINGGERGLIDLYKDNDQMKQAFLSETGKQLMEMPQKKTVIKMSEADIELSKALLDRFEIPENGPLGSEAAQRYNSWLSENIDEVQKVVDEHPEAVKNTSKSIAVKKALRNANSYRTNGATQIQTENDYQKASEIINSRVDQKEYENWLEDLFKGIVGEKGIYNGKDPFTASGKRKSWNALHWEYNLENIVKAMKQGEQKGVSVFGGSIYGSSSKEYKTIDDIHKDSGRLKEISEKDFETAKRDFQRRLREIAERLAKHDGGWDDAANMICEAVAKNRTKSGIASYLMREGKGWTNYNDYILEDIIDLVKDIRSMPTKYFEAKPQRAVGLDEIRAVVVPEDTGTQLKKQLSDNGINVLEYEKGNSEDRLEKINSIPDIAFSLSGVDDFDFTGNYDSGMSDLLKTGAKLLEGQQVDSTIVKKVAREIIKKNDSDYDAETLASNLEKVFAYMQTRKDISYNDLTNIMVEVAKPVVEESRGVNPAEKEIYDNFISKIKGKDVRLTDTQKQEVRNAFGTVKDFRGKLFGKMNITDKGSVYLDEIWDELREASGMMIEDVNEGDMPLALVDAIEALKPSRMNPYGENIEEAAYDCALQILHGYYDSFGDRADITAYRKKLRDEAREWRDKTRKAYDQRLDEVRQQAISRGEKVSEAVLKERARLRNSAIKAKERQEASKNKDTVIKIANQLIRLAEAPTDKRHFPDGLKEPVLDFLSGIDFVSGHTPKRWQETAQRLGKVLDEISENGNMGQDFDSQLAMMAESMDPDLGYNIQQFVEKNGKTVKLSDLSSGQLKELSRILTGLRSAINRSTEMYQNKMYENAAELGSKSIKEMDKRKERIDRTKLGGKLKDFFNVSMLDSISYFEELGPAAQSVLAELRDGFDHKVVRIRESQSWFEDMCAKEGITKKDFKAWTGNRATKTTFATEEGDITLTAGQIMEFYAHTKRAQSRGHYEFGGIKADNGRARPVHVTPELYQEMLGTLTEKQKKAVDLMQDYLSTVVSEWGNNVTTKAYGYSKFNERNYWPIKTDTNTHRTSDQNTPDNVSLYAVRNMSASKNTVKNAHNALILGDVFESFVDHIAQMATYEGMMLPLNDAMKWFNYKETVDIPGEQDLQYSYSVKESLERITGKGGQDFFIRFIKDLNGDAKQANDLGLISGMMSNYKAAAVGANMRVVVQQPTAIFRAINEIDAKYLIGASPSFFRAKKAAEWAQENSSIAQWKAWGYFDNYLGQSMKQVITDQSTTKEKIQDLCSKGAQIADDITWGVIYKAVELETKHETDLKPGTKEFNEYVAKRFDEIIDRTQVVDTVFHRSQLMRNKDSLPKLLTAFMMEPSKNYNMLHRAIVSGDKKKMARAAFAYVLNAIAAAAAASLMDALRHDDDETPFAYRYLSAFTGYEGENTNAAGVLTANAAGNINPIAQIPVLKEVMSAIEGYDSARMDVSWIYDIYDAAKEMVKKANGEGKKTWYAVAKKCAKAAGEATGIPFYALAREAETIFNNVTNLQYFKDKGVKNLALKMPGMYDGLDEAMYSGKDIEEEVQKILDAGKDKGAIGSNLSSKFKTQYNELSKLNDPEGREDFKELHDNLVKAFVAAGYEKEETESKLKMWAYGDGKSTSLYQPLHDAFDNGGDVQDEVKKLLDSGKDKKTIGSQLTSRYKPQLLELKKTDMGAAADLKNKLIKAYMAAGYTHDEAAKRIDKWKEEEK